MTTNSEIIQVAEAVARDKGISRNVVLNAMEQAISAASKKKYGLDNTIEAKIHPSTGDIQIIRQRVVVEEVTNAHQEISVEDANKYKPGAKVGDVISESLPQIDIARVVAQTAKQVIMQKVREAEQEKQYEEFKDKIGEIVSGSVKRVELNNVIIDLGRGEAILPRYNIIPGENFKVNDRVRASIESVNQNHKFHQIVLSRTSDQFLAKLFTQEVPEIYDKVIEIKAIAREPGSKAKVAVYTSDMHLDPVGSCVGVRGSRIHAIINELHGEKIDIVKWVSDPAKYVINALVPAKVSKIIMDEDANKIEVVVPQDQLSLAIGRKGQNVRLASKITKWHIDILSEDIESKRRIEEFKTSTSLFMGQLGLEEVLAQLLASEGFSNIDDIAYATSNELCAIEGIDGDLAEQLISRAKQVVAEQTQETSQELARLGVNDQMIELFAKVMSMPNVLKLANAGIKTFEDLGEITVREFKEIAPDSGLDDAHIKQLMEKAKSL